MLAMIVLYVLSTTQSCGGTKCQRVNCDIVSRIDAGFLNIEGRVPSGLDVAARRNGL